MIDALPAVSEDVAPLLSSGIVPDGPLAGSTRKRSEVETEDMNLPPIVSKEALDGEEADGDVGNADGEPPTKKFKLSGAQRRKIAKDEKKNKTGQNKGRRFQRVHDEQEICWKIACGLECPFGDKYVLTPV